MAMLCLTDSCSPEPRGGLDAGCFAVERRAVGRRLLRSMSWPPGSLGWKVGVWNLVLDLQVRVRGCRGWWCWFLWVLSVLVWSSLNSSVSLSCGFVLFAYVVVSSCSGGCAYPWSFATAVVRLGSWIFRLVSQGFGASVLLHLFMEVCKLMVSLLPPGFDSLWFLVARQGVSGAV